MIRGRFGGETRVDRTRSIGRPRKRLQPRSSVPTSSRSLGLCTPRLAPRFPPQTPFAKAKSRLRVPPGAHPLRPRPIAHSTIRLIEREAAGLPERGVARRAAVAGEVRRARRPPSDHERLASGDIEDLDLRASRLLPLTRAPLCSVPAAWVGEASCMRESLGSGGDRSNLERQHTHGLMLWATQGSRPLRQEPRLLAKCTAIPSQRHAQALTRPTLPEQPATARSAKW